MSVDCLPEPAPFLSPWEAVRLPIAKKEALRLLQRRHHRTSSDAVDELAAAIILEVSEQVSRGFHASRKVYRIAAHHAIESLWGRTEHRDVDNVYDESVSAVASCGDVDPEMHAVLMLDAAMTFPRLPTRQRDLLYRHLMGQPPIEAARDTGESNKNTARVLKTAMASLADPPSARCTACCCRFDDVEIRHPPREICDKCLRARKSERKRSAGRLVCCAFDGCKTEFVAHRDDQRFCKRACRSRHHNAQARLSQGA